MNSPWFKILHTEGTYYFYSGHEERGNIPNLQLFSRVEHQYTDTWCTLVCWINCWKRLSFCFKQIWVYVDISTDKWSIYRYDNSPRYATLSVYGKGSYLLWNNVWHLYRVRTSYIIYIYNRCHNVSVYMRYCDSSRLRQDCETDYHGPIDRGV